MSPDPGDAGKTPSRTCAVSEGPHSKSECSHERRTEDGSRREAAPGGRRALPQGNGATVAAERDEPGAIFTDGLGPVGDCTPSEHRRVPTTLVVEGGGRPPAAKRSAESRRKTLKRRKTQGSNPRWASRKVSASRGTSASEQRLEVECSRSSGPARADDGRDGNDERANDRGDAARAGAEGKASKGWTSEGRVEPKRKRASRDAKEQSEIA